MNKDKYGEIINGVDTFREIKNLLYRLNKNVVIGWTDGESHYDILFSANVAKPNPQNLQFGLATQSYSVFVSIMRAGCFAFEPTLTAYHDGNIDYKKSSPEYYAEKLGVAPNEALADLINEIRIVG